VEKRKPGRPVGTTKTLRADEALMRRAAAAMVREKHLKFSTALRDLGVSDGKDLARLRKRWKPIGDTYLEHALAEIRADQTIGQNVAEILRIAGVFDFARVIGQTLTKNRVSNRLVEIARSAENGWQGRDTSNLPFDPNDLDAIVEAIVHLETRDRSVDDALHQKEKTNEPLSDAQQMYLMAVALHATALNQFEVDKQNDEDRPKR